MEAFLDTFVEVLSWILRFMTLYTGLIGFLFFLPRRKYKVTSPKTRFAVLIPARNEENVIADIIESVQSQHYPAALYDIFVIPNNCTDRTAEVAAEAGCQKGVCGDQGRTGICRNGCCIFGRKLRGGSRCRKGREGNQRYRYGRCQFYKAAQPYPSGDRRPCHGHCPDLRFFIFLLHAVRRNGKCCHRDFLYSRR